MGNKTRQRSNKSVDMDLFTKNVAPPTTPNRTRETKVVLPLKSLAFRGYKCLGRFLSPSDVEKLVKSPYSHPLTKSKLPQNGTEVHFCFCPEIPTTVIPVEVGSLLGEIDRLKVKETQCSLQKQGCEKKYQGLYEELCGYSSSVRLDFVLMHAKDEAHRFHLDGAIILDLTHPLLSLPHPICLLGMDFLVRYPHLLFETRLDKRKELTFRPAKTLSLYRSFELRIDNQNEVIVDVEDHLHPKTGDVGCGIFFKTGSIFNSFSGVSKCDIWGMDCLERYWKVRAILVGVLKALQIVETSSIDRSVKPASVVIRTSNAAIEDFLTSKFSKIKAREQKPQEEDPTERDRSLEMEFPLAIRDVAIYYYENFIKRDPGFEIRFQHVQEPRNPYGTISAKLLAIAGSEMEEFYIENGSAGFFKDEELRAYPKKNYHDAVPLISHPGTSERSLYVSFWLDGYYLIPQERALMIMNLADQAGSTMVPDGRGPVDFRDVLRDGEPAISRGINGRERDKLSPTHPSEPGHDWRALAKDSSSDWRPRTGPIHDKIVARQPQIEKESLDPLRKEWIESIRKEYRNAKAQSKIGDKKAVDLSKVLELWKTGPESMKEEPNDDDVLCHINCKCRTSEGACKCEGPNSTIRCDCGPPLTTTPELHEIGPRHKILGATGLGNNAWPPGLIGNPGSSEQWGARRRIMI